MLTLWYRLPLALKIALPVALLSFLSALVVIGVTQYSQQRLLHQRTDGLGAALVSRLAASAARPLVENDPVSLQAALAGFAGEGVVQRAVVFDLKQKLVASAGDGAPDTWDYSATIHWQDSAVGRAVLSLRPSVTRGYYPQLGDLLVLAGILAALSAVCGLWMGQRAEALLAALTRKLSGEQIDFKYRGNDALARLLHVPPPPLLVPEVAPPRGGIILLHLYCPDAGSETCRRALRLTESVCKLYGGEVRISRAGGITARFAVNDEFEEPFRALCCAEMLARLGAGAGYRLALAAVASADDGNVWLEQRLIEHLHAACAQAPAGYPVQVDAQLQRHPAIRERGTLESAGPDMWYVVALVSPYDTLLERQLQTLQAQLGVAGASAAPA